MEKRKKKFIEICSNLPQQMMTYNYTPNFLYRKLVRKLENKWMLIDVDLILEWSETKTEYIQ